MANPAWQAPPDRSADDDRASHQEETHSVAAQCGVNFFDLRPYPPGGTAQRVGKGAEKCAETDRQLIKGRTVLRTAP
jgi:hypothetical protein